MSPTVDVHAVTECIEAAARALVLPRFKRLAPSEVEGKQTPGDSDDIVTIVDREVEAHLTAALQSHASAAHVIGEESVHHRPDTMRLLDGETPLWIIDPIDGTKNFAAGHSAFGIMVSYVLRGNAVAAWIVLPAREQTFVAEAGGGAFLNGQRIRVAPRLREDILRGAVFSRYMPDGMGAAVNASLQSHVRPLPPSGCAAVDYTDLLFGVRDFVIYYRLLPWDHAAPALVLTEAGGLVRHASGLPYTARSPHQLTLAACNADTVDRLCSWLPPT